MEAFSVIEGACSEQLSPSIASSARGIPLPVDIEIGIISGRLRRAVDEHSPPSQGLSLLCCEQGSVPIFQVAQGDLIFGCSNQRRIFCRFTSQGLFALAHRAAEIAPKLVFIRKVAESRIASPNERSWVSDGTNEAAI